MFIFNSARDMFGFDDLFVVAFPELIDGTMTSLRDTDLLDDNRSEFFSLSRLIFLQQWKKRQHDAQLARSLDSDLQTALFPKNEI